MAIDDAMLYRAQQGDRSALVDLLAAAYPAVYRMAYALAGRPDVGHGIVHFVTAQAARRIDQWRDADAAQRWFYHHTVLTGRRAAHHQPEAMNDLLLRGAADARYLAFLRALRGLSQQQREAFILNHGEHLNTRFLAVAMDCSTHAAEMHLAAADQALRKMSGDVYEAMVTRLSHAYSALAPDDQALRPTVRSIVRRSNWPRRLRRIAIGVIVLGMLAAGAWVAWRLRHP